MPSSLRLTDADPIRQHRLGGAGMSWLPNSIVVLRDISIVAILGYGLRLMKQQNELLEQEKALKQSEIDVHKASIERLKALQAPAIARDLEQRTRTAESYAKKKKELEERVEILAKESQEAKAEMEMSNTIGIAAGSLEAMALLYRMRDSASAYSVLSGDPVENNYILKMLDENLSQIAATAEQALRGQKPDLRHMKQWLAELAKERASRKVE